MVTCHDFTTVERSVVERAIGEKRDGSPLLGKADTRGRAGGLKGGLARALSLNPNDRSKIAASGPVAPVG